MEKQIQNTECPLLVGVDVGSTTTKIVAVDRMTGQIVYSDYQRHGAAQLKSVARALKLLMLRFPKARVRLALTGSGAKGVAEQLGACYIQEVVANSIALRRRYAHVRTAIELGGQDAKIIFFHRDENTGNLNVSDMRMNGSCAGGTGAFLDEIAALLKVPMEEFDDLARRVPVSTISPDGAASTPRRIFSRCSTRVSPSRIWRCPPCTPLPSRPLAVWLRVWRSKRLWLLRAAP